MTSKKDSAERTLSKALEKTVAVKKELEVAEDELAVAHAVLETKLVKAAHDAEVRKAVNVTTVAKKRVSKSVKDLGVVEEVLESKTQSPD